MKKITKSIIAVFAISTALISCTKDNSTDSLQGNWTIDSVVASTPDKDPKTIRINGSCATKNYMSFKAAGAYEEGDLDTISCEITKVNGTWKKTNNTLETVDSDNNTTTYNIMSSTSNKLVLRITDLGSQTPTGTYIEATLSKK